MPGASRWPPIAHRAGAPEVLRTPARELADDVGGVIGRQLGDHLGKLLERQVINHLVANPLVEERDHFGSPAAVQGKQHARTVHVLEQLEDLRHVGASRSAKAALSSISEPPLRTSMIWACSLSRSAIIPQVLMAWSIRTA